MKVKVGVRGSADDALAGGVSEAVRERARCLGREIAARGSVRHATRTLHVAGGVWMS
ncbi:MAG TPA: hypothetical protein VM095_01215 [Pyrinomonadaceae bacterium]|nr:hypothetical protein [Pyrinomonadaceae bacterium]